jgi:hypothetical protein
MNSETSRSNLTIPILAVSGEVSPFGGGDTKSNYSLESARRLADNISEILMPSAGHWIPEEQPGPLAGLLIKFFNEKSQLPSTNKTGSKATNAIEDLITMINNESLLESNTSRTDNLSTSASPDQTSPATLANLSTGSVQGPGSNKTIRSAEQIANQLTGNGSVEPARNTETQIPLNQSEGNLVREEPLADEGTPLSEAIEAISKLFGRNNGG